MENFFECQNCKLHFLPEKCQKGAKSYCDFCIEAVVRDNIEINIKIGGEKNKLVVRIDNFKEKNETLEKENTELKNKVSKLEEELVTERATNLAMLENLKVLNEQKYNDRLASALKEKTQRIEFLEKLLFENSSNRKLESLEAKYSELVIEKN